MKTVPLAFATAIALVFGFAPVSHAQQNDRDASNGPHGSAAMQQQPNQEDRGAQAQPDWHGPPHGRMGPGRMMEGGAQWGPPAGAEMCGRWMSEPGFGRRGWNRGRGAHFTFRRGDARVDIRCPSGTSLKECADAAGTLIDKIARMGPPPPPPPSVKPPMPMPNGHGGAPTTRPGEVNPPVPNRT